jgi:hypothetical protein
VELLLELAVMCASPSRTLAAEVVRDENSDRPSRSEVNLSRSADREGERCANRGGAGDVSEFARERALEEDSGTGVRSRDPGE